MKFTRNLQLLLLSLICRLSVADLTPSILSTVDYLTSSQDLYWCETNVVGIAYDLPEFLPWASNPILLSRINLAVYSGWLGNTFAQIFHVPLGYKYNCSSTIYGGTVACTKELILNSS